MKKNTTNSTMTTTSVKLNNSSSSSNSFSNPSKGNRAQAAIKTVILSLMAIELRFNQKGKV